MPGSKGLDVLQDKSEISTTVDPQNDTNVEDTNIKDNTEVENTDVNTEDKVEESSDKVENSDTKEPVDESKITEPEPIEPEKYNTDPVPAGKPEPVEPENAVVGTNSYMCTISIVCPTILDNMEICDPNKVELVPADGVFLAPTTVTFYEGESVFNVLLRTCKQNKIHMEYVNTPIYNSAYIEGIGNIYEFDVGEGSGWMYDVNGWFPNYGVSRYQLSNGDVIKFQYTCDLGDDIGGGNAF